MTKASDVWDAFAKREALPAGVVHGHGVSQGLHQPLPHPWPPLPGSSSSMGRGGGTSHCQAALGYFSNYTAIGSMS